MKGERARFISEELLPVVLTLGALLIVAAAPLPVLGASDGKAIVETNCAGCHGTGVLGAPKLGDKEAWAPRLKQGGEVLLQHALNGLNAMPPRGGNSTLSDEDMAAAVGHMLSLVGASLAGGAPAAAGKAETTAAAGGSEEKAAPAKEPEVKAAKAEETQGGGTDPQAAAGEPANRSGKAVVIPATAPAAEPAKPQKVAAPANRVNTFNRLMRPPSKRNPPPAQDGIHDPANDGTALLQHPRDAFADLPKGIAGNHVDWVKSLEGNDITPRYDRLDPARQPVVLDLNIVREVKGSMPNVVYPHKQHTEWLDCSNCHPAIFIPKKGANNLSMASILLGQQCGVCHGKVAFPVAECRRCHSQNKPAK